MEGIPNVSAPHLTMPLLDTLSQLNDQSYASRLISGDASDMVPLDHDNICPVAAEDIISVSVGESNSTKGTKFCTQCGHKAWEDAKFCQSCGTQLEQQPLSDSDEVTNHNSNGFDCATLKHPKQNMALPNHVMLFYQNLDIYESNCQIKIMTRTTIVMIFVLIVAAVVLMWLHFTSKDPKDKKLWFGIFCAMTSVAQYMIIREGRIKLIVEQTMRGKDYSYWCYDISDQCIKLCVIDHLMKSILTTKYVSDILDINDFIAQVKCCDDESSKTYFGCLTCNFAGCRDGTNELQEFEMLGHSKEKFCNELQACTDAILQFGLDEIKLQYQTCTNGDLSDNHDPLLST